MESATPATSTTTTNTTTPTPFLTSTSTDIPKVFTFDAADVVSMTKMDASKMVNGASGSESFAMADTLEEANPGASKDDFKYPVDVQQWRDTGFGAYRLHPDGMYPPRFWGPAYGGYPVSGPSSGLSRESSRDDLTSMEGQIFEYEERFRVDRRKLELMMIGRYEPIKEPALDFFQRIGEETTTTIIWPSRLKIGAKSKKDPHIRIGGTEECVKRAKSLIMEYLDTKTTRVTMKMDVSYTDHSHVIGKGGNTIRRVMAETGCHIHFPDSNRSNPNEKSNQVSIAGEMEGVEKARARVRELAPLVFTFDLPIVPSIEAVPHDLNEPYLKAIQDQYNIQIMFRQKQKNFPTTVVVVKGCEWESARVKEATLMLVDHLCGRYAASSHPVAPLTPTGGSDASAGGGSSGGNGRVTHAVPISMNVEISPIHHSVVLGKGNMALRSIMQRTKTTILFPDASDPNIPPIRKGSVTITGSIHNVYFARQQLLGSLPIVMMFEMPDNLDMLDEAGIQKLQEDLDICVSIKPKQRQANKSVLIKAQERNASAMYKARQILLGLEGEAIQANIPETYKMQQAFGDTFYSLNNNDPMFRLSTNPKTFGFNSLVFGNPPGLPAQLRYLQCHALQSPHLAAEAAAAAASYPDPNGLMALLNQKPNYPPPFSTPHVSGKHSVRASPSSSSPSVFAVPGQRFDPPFPSQPSMIRNKWSSFNQPPPLAINPQQQPPFGNSLPPNHPFLQDYARLVLKNITRLQQQEQSLAKDDPNNNYIQVDNGKDMKVVSPEAPRIMQKCSSPRNSSGGGDLSRQLEELDLDSGRKLSPDNGINRASTSSDSSRGSEFVRFNGSQPLPNASGSSQSQSQPQPQTQPQRGSTSSDSENACDWRAPGWEKKTLEMAVKNQICEYDTKRLLAAKALQTKPSPNEARTPTTTWSGLGFSSSMPEAMIREQLNSEDSSTSGPGQQEPPSQQAIQQAVAAAAAAAAVAAAGGTAPTASASPPTTTTASGTGNWFGNSSALDSFLNPKTLVNDPSQFDDDLPSLFAKQGLAKYTDLFLRHEVDIQTFASLTEQDLKEIGIQTFGARKKLLLLANKVKQLLSVNDSIRNHHW